MMIIDTLPMLDSFDLLLPALHEQSEEHLAVLEVVPEVPLCPNPPELLPALI